MLISIKNNILLSLYFTLSNRGFNNNNSCYSTKSHELNSRQVGSAHYPLPHKQPVYFWLSNTGQMVCHQVLKIYSQTTLYCCLLQEFFRISSRRKLDCLVRVVRAAWQDQRSATGPDGWGNPALFLACGCLIKRATDCTVFQCVHKILCFKWLPLNVNQKRDLDVSTLHAVFIVWGFKCFFF